MTPSTRKKGIVTSVGVLTAVATLLSGGVTTAYANDALTNPNSAMGYPTFSGRTNLPRKTSDFRRRSFSLRSRYLCRHSLFYTIQRSFRYAFFSYTLLLYQYSLKYS